MSQPRAHSEYTVSRQWFLEICYHPCSQSGIKEALSNHTLTTAHLSARRYKNAETLCKVQNTLSLIGQQGLVNPRVFLDSSLGHSPGRDGVLWLETRALSLP